MQEIQKKLGEKMAKICLWSKKSQKDSIKTLLRSSQFRARLPRYRFQFSSECIYYSIFNPKLLDFYSTFLLNIKRLYELKYFVKNFKYWSSIEFSLLNCFILGF